MTAAAQEIAQKVAGAARHLAGALKGRDFMRETGHVVRIGNGIVTASIRGAFVGEICRLREPGTGRVIEAQVVSIDGTSVNLSPFEPVDGLSQATEVVSTGEDMQVPVGDWLIGRVVDAFGRPIDGMARGRCHWRAMMATQVSPLDRTIIDTVFPTGVRAIDLFNTVGDGQRMAVFGPPGAGKSTLLSMLASHSACDVVVLAMIGERGREVREFLDRALPEEVRDRTVVVASTSDRPAIERVIAGHSALAMAEDFRERGKRVLLLFDSVTRFARALRDVGLAAGEQAVRQGLTSSVYAELPRLFERAGKTRTGSITAFFTVLMENEGVNDAIAEEVTSLSDGHIVLDPKLAAGGHYPAISMLKSKSRLMREIAPRELTEAASFFRAMAAAYQEIELLLQVGEYERGNDPDSDLAIDARPVINKLLRQPVDEKAGFDDAVREMTKAADDLRNG
ncbi:flagellum-specific ATP synthase FliI [Zhengella mangrovi]|uniref:Flagellum-specific ATP synthase FliI n=1 Tax=Zhengella mangrovi TaxID=1982044 RepID=A0A2G1QLY6_9HYPH|nr:FliI/YscN family ATPase [Zhengella mangrovi]PHP66484.1 flagellum-specific ATP synthase FliI [Zhengella mangrovi]